MADRQRLMRQSFSALIGSSSLPLLGPNPRRLALIISPPPSKLDGGSVVSVNAQAADTSTTGVKLSTTIPAGSTGTVTQASIFDVVGTTQKLTLEIKRGAVVTSIVTLTASGTINPGIQLLAGDTIQWDCTSAVALSTTDLAISVMLTPITSRVSLGFQGAAILDQGITLHPGNAPVILLGDHIGQAIREDITAIAAFSGTAISGLDIFEVDCPCNPDTMWKQ